MSYPSLDLYVLTFNCGHNLIDIPSLSSTLFNAVDHLPDLVVISLQEISPIPHGLVGGTLLSPYYNRVKEAVEIAARNLSGTSSIRYGSQPTIYTNVATHNIGMTVIMAFARDAEAVRNIQTAEVGVGISNMGAKGAVGLRFTYADAAKDGETELTFVAAHLAAMEWDMERRNEDWKNIVKGLVFSSGTGDDDADAVKDGSQGREEGAPLLPTKKVYNGIYKPTSHLFLAGDLNYRTSSIKPSPTDHEDAFPQPYHLKTSPQHYSVLYQKDQLNQERLAGRTCHGLIEAPVTFPPTYKYDPAEQPAMKADEELDFWHWAPHRWPSWTDRILFLDVPEWLKRENPKAKIQLGKYIALPLFSTSDHRAVALNVKVPLIRIPEPDEEEDADSTDPRIRPPFEVDPEWRTKRAVARKEELFVGISGFLTATWQGWCVVLGTIAGVVGGYFLVRAALDF
jgi:hypothetical protein